MYPICRFTTGVAAVSALAIAARFLEQASILELPTILDFMSPQNWLRSKLPDAGVGRVNGRSGRRHRRKCQEAQSEETDLVHLAFLGFSWGSILK